jgi:hypothetical protein
MNECIDSTMVHIHVYFTVLCVSDDPRTSWSFQYTGLCGGLEHLKIETMLIDERFASVMGECVILTTHLCRRYSK